MSGENHDELDLDSIVNPQRTRMGAMFALRVEGESMRAEGIVDGDFILVERAKSAADGDRVVVILPGGETVLRLYYRSTDPKDLDVVYRAAARKAHPDAGGSNEMMAKVNRAKDFIEKARGGA